MFISGSYLKFPNHERKSNSLLKLNFNHEHLMLRNDIFLKLLGHRSGLDRFSIISVPKLISIFEFRFSLMLPIYINVSTSSTGFPSSMVALVLAVLHLRIFLSPLCMLRSLAIEAAATLTIFTWICCCVWDRITRLSVKSKLFGCILAVHYIPCLTLRNGHLPNTVDHEKK